VLLSFGVGLRTEMMRMSSSRGVQTTTLKDPKMFAPRVTNRCSPSDDSSSIVAANGSFKTPSPSASERPCFLRFATFFLGSKVAVTETVYAYNAYIARPARKQRSAVICYEIHNQTSCLLPLALLLQAPSS